MTEPTPTSEPESVDKYAVQKAKAKEAAAKVQAKLGGWMSFLGDKAKQLQQNVVESQTKTRRLTSAQDLGICHVTERILAMSFPSSDVMRDGQPKIDNVADFLQRFHSGHFMIWNLSEKPYDYAKFDDQVIEFKFPGYPAPPLEKVFAICASLHSWLKADPKNVACVHCQTGKGRTATVIASYLSWAGLAQSPGKACLQVAQARNTPIKQIIIPTQTRYLNYFSRIMLKHQMPEPHRIRLRKIIMNTVPCIEKASDGFMCCRPYIQIFQKAKLLFSSAANPDQVNQLSESDGGTTFTIDPDQPLELQGDLLVRMRHVSSDGSRCSMLRAGFHTGYCKAGVVRFTKKQLDGAVDDKRYSDEFWLDFVFEVCAEVSESERHSNREHWQHILRNGREELADSKFGHRIDELDSLDVADDEKTTDEEQTGDFDDLERYMQGLHNLETTKPDGNDFDLDIDLKTTFSTSLKIDSPASASAAATGEPSAVDQEAQDALDLDVEALLNDSVVDASTTGHTITDQETEDLLKSLEDDDSSLLSSLPPPPPRADNNSTTHDDDELDLGDLDLP